MLGYLIRISNDNGRVDRQNAALRPEGDGAGISSWLPAELKLKENINYGRESIPVGRLKEMEK